jgi:hypothetical protein
MVKDVALNVFVVRPGGIIGEGVQLDRQAGLAGRELAHQQGHAAVMDLWVVAQVGHAVGSEGADVGQAAAVDKFGQVVANVGVVLANVFELGFQVGAQDVDTFEAPVYILLRLGTLE